MDSIGALYFRKTLDNGSGWWVWIWSFMFQIWAGLIVAVCCFGLGGFWVSDFSPADSIFQGMDV